MPYTALLFAVRDSIARITLNRPDTANAINSSPQATVIQRDTFR